LRGLLGAVVANAVILSEKPGQGSRFCDVSKKIFNPDFDTRSAELASTREKPESLQRQIQELGNSQWGRVQ
jgi:hypothetical protein